MTRSRSKLFWFWWELGYSRTKSRIMFPVRPIPVDTHTHIYIYVKSNNAGFSKIPTKYMLQLAREMGVCFYWWVLICVLHLHMEMLGYTVYPKKYAHGFCFAVLCCGYTLTDFPISIRLTSLALWQSNDCPSASKATLMNMDKYFMWSHYERLHNHNKAKHNKTVCIFLGIYCTSIHMVDTVAI